MASNNLEEDIQQYRQKLKNIRGLGVLLHRIHATNDNLYEVAEELLTSRKKFFESKVKLRDVSNEIQQLRDEVNEKKNNLITLTGELREAVSQLKSVDVNKLNKQEALILKLDSWLVEEDVIEAWKHINYAEDELNEDENCEEKMNKRKKRKTKSIRTLNSVSIPNVVSSGIVALNGSININRNKCCICLEGRLNAVLYKCGHICLCYICASELMKKSENRKCPVCRTDIVDVIRTYYA